MGTLQFPFGPQRGAKSLGSGTNTRNLTDFEEEGGKIAEVKAKISSRKGISLITQLSICVILLFGYWTKVQTNEPIVEFHRRIV